MVSGTNPELVNVLKNILENTVYIAYYLMQSTRAWYEIVEFVNSTKALLVLFSGIAIGWLLGKNHASK